MVVLAFVVMNIIAIGVLIEMFNDREWVMFSLVAMWLVTADTGLILSGILDIQGMLPTE